MAVEGDIVIIKHMGGHAIDQGGVFDVAALSEGMSEASARRPLRPARDRPGDTTGSRAPAIITPKQSVNPVLATARASAGTSWQVEAGDETSELGGESGHASFLAPEGALTEQRLEQLCRR